MIDIKKRIYAAFSTAPLKDDQLKELYVNLDSVRGNADVVRRITQRIVMEEDGKPTCQVLAGHDGSGKSTELARLKTMLEEQKYFVVLCAIDKDVDRNDVDFPDVLIAMVRQMAEQLKEHAGVTVKPGYFKDRLNELMTFLKSDIGVDKFDLGASLMKVTGTLKSSPDVRQQIRKMLEPETNNLIYAANAVIDEAQHELAKKGYTGLAILVDDLDKMIMRQHDSGACSTQEYLFVHRSSQLTAFNCHVVYTMPLELAYSNLCAVIEKIYGKTPVIPMVKITTRPPENKPYPHGIELFEKVIDSRLHEAGAERKTLFVNDEVMHKLIMLSGGQLTELMSLVQESLVSYGMPIDEASLHRAKTEGQRTYARHLRTEHWPIIDSVMLTGEPKLTSENDKIFRDLLESRAILLYINDEEWYGVNPFLEGLHAPALNTE